MRTMLVLLALIAVPCRLNAADTVWSAMIVEPSRWGWTVIGGSAIVTITESDVSFVIQGSTNAYYDGRLFKGKIKKEGTITRIYDVQSVLPTSGTAIGRPYEGIMDYTYPQTAEGEMPKPDSQHIHLTNEFRFIGLARQFGIKE